MQTPPRAQNAKQEVGRARSHTPERAARALADDRDSRLCRRPPEQVLRGPFDHALGSLVRFETILGP